VVSKRGESLGGGGETAHHRKLEYRKEADHIKERSTTKTRKKPHTFRVPSTIFPQGGMGLPQAD